MTQTNPGNCGTASLLAPDRGGREGHGRARQKSPLLVASEPQDLLADHRALEGGEFDVHSVGSVPEALQALAFGDFHLVLADLAMRPIAGLQLLDWVRQHYPRVARVLVTGAADLELAGAAISQGRINDCLLRPLRPGESLQGLRGAVKQSLRESNLTRSLDELRRLRLGWRRQLLAEDRLLRRAADDLARNVAEIEEDNRRLRRHSLLSDHQATTDPLTGLLNRRGIEAILDYELDRRTRYPGALALGLVDADHFKEVNRRHLHSGGDQALVGLARVLASSLRASDRVGRIGGEEFLVIAPQTDVNAATSLAERLRIAVEQSPVRVSGQAVRLTESIGFAVVEAGTVADHGQLKRLADSALAEAKDAGRNCSVVRSLTTGTSHPG